jgi:hypothetical protein
MTPFYFSYASNAKKLSSILKDKLRPLDSVTAHTVKSLAGSKKWPRMTAARRLNWFQFYLLDSLAAMAGAVVLTVAIGIRLMRCVGGANPGKMKK